MIVYWRRIANNSISSDTIVDEDNRRLAVESLDAIDSYQEDVAVTVAAVVDELWDPNHENTQQVGLVREGPTKVKFTVWKGNDVPQLSPG